MAWRLRPCWSSPSASNFLGGPNTGSPGPSASESVPGTVTPSAAAACGPTGLGYFDVDAFEELFGQGLTRQTAVNGNEFYQADAGTNVHYVFVIDPDRDDNAIIAASNQINDVREPVSAAAQEDLDLWFSTIGACQPSAVEWIQPQLDDFIATPGAEISEEKHFADGSAVKASFTTTPDFFGSDPGKYYHVSWAIEAIAP